MKKLTILMIALVLLFAFSTSSFACSYNYVIHCQYKPDKTKIDRPGGWDRDHDWNWGHDDDHSWDWGGGQDHNQDNHDGWNNDRDNGWQNDYDYYSWSQCPDPDYTVWRSYHDNSGNSDRSDSWSGWSNLWSQFF